MSPKRNTIQNQYYIPIRSGSYTSRDKIKHSYKGKQNIEKWLKAQRTQSLHKPIQYKFKRVPTFANDIDYLWQMDVAFLDDLKNFNNGNRYLLTCIDVFSKYAWVYPLKNKSAVSILETFKKILESGRKPQKLQTDKGKEFENKVFQKFLKDNSIHFYTSNNYDIKAAVVERFNRTLKTKMYKYFTAKKTKKYLNVLPNLVKSYNNTYHRSIGMTPNTASKIKTPEEKAALFMKLYPAEDKKDKPSFNIGDMVRVSRLKKTFRKGYLANWSEEIFTIDRIYELNQPILYGIKDLKGEIIQGRFYKQELQKVFS